MQDAARDVIIQRTNILDGAAALRQSGAERLVKRGNLVAVWRQCFGGEYFLFQVLVNRRIIIARLGNLNSAILYWLDDDS